MDFLNIKDINVQGKTILLRADLDVALSEDRKILDETRLKASLLTIQYLLEHGAKVIIAGHLGRPNNKYPMSNVKFQISNEDRKFSLEPVAEWFTKEIKNQKSKIKNTLQKLKIGDFEGWELSSNLFLLENLRFYEGEKENSEEFAKELSALADVYVNDAFAVCHRNHASIVGITKFLPSYAGLHLVKEIEELSRVLNNPKRPLAVVIGGLKIETKLPLISKMNSIADYVLVGGLIAQQKEAFDEVQEETNKTEETKGVKAGRAEIIIADSNEDKTDITENSVIKFTEIIKNAGTIVWNGPMGKVDEIRSEKGEVGNKGNEDSERGTREIAQAIISSKAYKIAGGGDTTEYLERTGITDKFDFVSTGGGAMLSFLSGERLPGLEALSKKEGNVSKVSEVSKGEKLH